MHPKGTTGMAQVGIPKGNIAYWVWHSWYPKTVYDAYTAQVDAHLNALHNGYGTSWYHRGW